MCLTFEPAQENNGYHKSITPGWKDTVFVSANYRTGIFGFLASPSLSKRSGASPPRQLLVQDVARAMYIRASIARCPPSALQG